MQKLLVYRGHNNIESLIEFYQRLLLHAAEVERHNFSKSAIRKMLI